MWLRNLAFESPWQICLNLVTIGAFLAIVGVFFWSAFRGRKLRLRDLLLLIGFSVAGVYVPVFPLVWLFMEREDSQMPDGSIRWPLGVKPKQ